MTTKQAPFTLGSKKTPVTDIYPTHEFWESLGYLAEELKESIEEGNYTKDYPQLARRHSHLVFVYGTLKKGYRNHPFLGKGAKFKGYGYTSQDTFFMLRNSYSKYPVAFYDAREEVKARLFGEVWEVAPETMRSLDYLESNGVSFKRMPIFVDLKIKDSKTEKIRVWSYLGMRDYWKDRQEVLEPGRKIKSMENKPYYIFTTADQE